MTPPPRSASSRLLSKWIPGNTKALERLAVLMIAAGRVKESEELHRRKAEIDRAHDRYRKMLIRRR